MVEFIEHVAYEDLPTPERCFVIGAGASYDSGVTVERYILDAANWCMQFLRDKPLIGSFESSAAELMDKVLTTAKRILGDDLIGPLDPLYQKLDDAEQAMLNRVVVFVLSRVRWDDGHGTYCCRHDSTGRDKPFSYQRFRHELKPTDVVVTFNYDPFLEMGISPPWKIHYGAPISPWPTTERYPVRGKDELVTIRLLCLHGSAGWLACPRCGCTEDFGYMNISELGICSTVERQKDTDAYCPQCMRNIGLSAMGLESVSSFGSESVYRMFERKHCMILPAARRSYDSEPLRTIWRLCESALSVCKEIVAVGYSIPPVDVAFRECLERAVIGRTDKPSVMVVDPSSVTQATWHEFAASVGLSPPTAKISSLSAWLDELGVPVVEEGTTP